MRDEKLHAVVARSTFRSQNVQSTPAPDHFWKLRSRKSARRCGVKHISKSKCIQNTPGPDHFWKLRCRKSARVVVRSTFRSQNVQGTPAPDHFWKLRSRKSARRCGVKHISKSKCIQNTPGPDHFWKLRRWKSARRCGAKHISKSKCTKHTRSGPLLEDEMSKKCTPLWREAAKHMSKSKVQKNYGLRTLLDVQNRSDVLSRGRRKGLCTLSKVSKTWGFCSISKNDGRRGAFEEDLERCILSGRRSTKDMFIRDVRRSGRWFPEMGCILEHQIFRLLRWFCVAGAALRTTWYHFCVAGTALYTDGAETSQDALVRGRQRCTQLSIFAGSLAELLCFWCCQIQKL